MWCMHSFYLLYIGWTGAAIIYWRADRTHTDIINFFLFTTNNMTNAAVFLLNVGFSYSYSSINKFKIFIDKYQLQFECMFLWGPDQLPCILRTIYLNVQIVIVLHTVTLIICICVYGLVVTISYVAAMKLNEIIHTLFL